MLEQIDQQRKKETLRVTKVLCTLIVVSLITIALFMTVGAVGSWSFVLPHRGMKLLVLSIVGCAIAISTVVFQSLTHNNIITPSILGFDKLYVLVHTLIAFFLTNIYTSFTQTNLMFFINVAVMTFFSTLLFQWLFLSQKRSLHLVLLIGIVFGSFFGSLTTFMQRILEPTVFTVLQDKTFADFNKYDGSLMYLSVVVISITAIILWRKLPTLDVLSLGRNNAVNLGVNYTMAMFQFLVIINILVAFATALVGPITFLGLIVVHLARAIVKSSQHKVLLPTACLVALIILVGGQLILERIFSFNTALSIIVEFIGGLLFFILLLRQTKIKSKL